MIGSVRKAALFLSLALCAADGLAQTAESPTARFHGNRAILAVNNSVSFSYLRSHLYYIEPGNINGSNYLDFEKGYMSGGKVSLSYMGYLGTENAFVRAEWGGSEGKVDYNGYLIGGPPYTPVNGKSRATVQDMDLKVGKGFALGRRVMATPYATIGKRYWMRELGLGTPGDYVESYNAYYYALGAMLQCSPWQRLVLTADAAIGRTTDPSINVRLNGVPVLRNAGLGQALVKKFGGELDYRAAANVHLFAGYDYTYFTFGQSTVQPSGYYEPFSKTSAYNYNFGVRLSFDLQPFVARGLMLEHAD